MKIYPYLCLLYGIIQYFVTKSVNTCQLFYRSIMLKITTLFGSNYFHVPFFQLLNNGKVACITYQYLGQT